jgi:ribosomal protein L11 methyltransferase
MARNEEIQEKLLATSWDLVIFDEAHKLSAHFYGNKVEKTGRFQLAEKLGASLIKAIDNDDRSIENAAENISQNNCRKIILELNDKPSSRNKYDVVLANINRNIITENFSQLVPVMQTGAHLLISGLLVNDEESVIRLALATGLHLSAKQNRGGWILLQFNKN